MTLKTLTRPLTINQYKIHKRYGITDERIMSLHGYNSVSLREWKEMNLRKLLNEKTQHTLSVDSETLEHIAKTVTSAPSVSGTQPDKQTPSEPVETLKTPSEASQPSLAQLDQERLAAELAKRTEQEDAEYISGSLSVGNPQTNMAANVNMHAIENAELQTQIKWLEERHVKDTADMDKVNEEIAYQKKRGNQRCDELMIERRKNQKLYAENQNLLAQVKRQDELLIAADRDSKLLFAVMAKAVEQNKKIVEGLDD